jgi:hypothetical protein
MSEIFVANSAHKIDLKLLKQQWHHVRCFDVICGPEQADKMTDSKQRDEAVNSYWKALHVRLCCKISSLLEGTVWCRVAGDTRTGSIRQWQKHQWLLHQPA